MEKNHEIEKVGKEHLTAVFSQLHSNDCIWTRAGSLPFAFHSSHRLRHFAEIPMNEIARAASEFQGFGFWVSNRN